MIDLREPDTPTKSILTKQDLEDFQISPGYTRIMSYLESLNKAITNKSLRNGGCCEAEIITLLVGMLDKLLEWIIQIPPVEIGLSRFGNPAFKVFYDRVESDMDTLIPFVEESKRAEVGTYLLSSFGDPKRIDYGTGHEANFICFLICLDELQIVKVDDQEALVSKVFWKYIKVMRELQKVYWLEPAGSHGVWGLDDYNFLPFLFGSAQLMNHKYLRPKSIHDKDILEEMSLDFMYFSCVQHINSIKSASLRWHSPMLDDISGVKKWSKVNEGMFKMYKAEVLNKLPIMQHFLFGSMIPFKGSNSHVSEEMEHIHALGQEYPGCCSIRVPSAIAAHSNAPRPLPFD